MMRLTACLALIEAKQDAYHSRDNQEKAQEVELGDVLTECLVMLWRVQVKREEEEG